MNAGALAQVAAPATRLFALDWMRGLVMVLMTIDHASSAFNAGRLMKDGAWMWRPGMELAADQFFLRWVTHLCAPTFVFLAGAAVALSAVRRGLLDARGRPKRSAAAESRVFDRYLLLRGLLLVALDPAWMSLAFTGGRPLFQVLYAIGASLVCLAVLRRVGTRAMLALAAVIAVGSEGAAFAVREGGLLGYGVFEFLLTGGRLGPVIVGYPLLPWLAMLLLGWCFGVWLASRSREGSSPVAPHSLRWGAGALLVFFFVRLGNAYGNFGVTRDDHSIVQWLHVSKYPPSLTFTTLELGLGALLLAGFLFIERRPVLGRALPPDARGPLLVFGQTALFFYVLHAHLLVLAAHWLGVHKSLGILETLIAAGACLVVLYPACLAYRAYKRQHPNGWSRYL